jgi:hypothetical protein
MLFDLRGRGRRRSVRIIYTGLALLFAVGFVGFGVGVGGGGGGIINSLTSNEGSGGTVYASEIKKYSKLTQQQPNNVSAWEHLLSAQLHEAGNEMYVTRTGQLTSKGKELFVQIGHSWNSYLALNPKPNAELAQRMVPVFGEEGLNEPAAAVQVLQIVVADRPTSASLYASLAAYAYKAHNTRVGDLASEKAVSLAPTSGRQRLKNQLAALKNHPNGTSEEPATSSTGGKFTVKRSHGKITATPSTPTTSSTTTTQLPSLPAKK